MHEESAGGVSQAAVGRQCTEGIELARELILAVFRTKSQMVWRSRTVSITRLPESSASSISDSTLRTVVSVECIAFNILLQRSCQSSLLVAFSSGKYNQSIIYI